MSEIRVVTEPAVICIARSVVDTTGLNSFREFVQEYRRDRLSPDGSLALHSGEVPYTEPVADLDLLPELAGRVCYYSFGEKMGRKQNDKYLENCAQHPAVFYHGKLTLFIGNISLRVGEELIRHHVGADKQYEGNPCKESMRYVEHSGVYVATPGDCATPESLAAFTADMQAAHDRYLSARDFMLEEDRGIHLRERLATLRKPHGLIEGGCYGESPRPDAISRSMARKRVNERASGRLSRQAACSLMLTMNLVSLAKLLKERCNLKELDVNHPADLEFQRLALRMLQVAREVAPNSMDVLLGK